MAIDYLGFNQPEDDEFLSKVPITVLEQSISTQFRDPNNFRVDYVASFIRQYKYSIENCESDEEIMDVNSLHDEFIDFMEKCLLDKLNVGIENLGDMSYDEQEELILFVYRFFLINIRKNFTNVFYNYIMENKERLVENAKRTKDITFQAFKDKLTEEDTIIIANLSDFIDECMEDGRLDVDDFLRLCEGDEPCTETVIVSDNYNEYILTGNFVSKYFRLLRTPLRIIIEGDLRSKILKPYREDIEIVKGN